MQASRDGEAVAVELVVDHLRNAAIHNAYSGSVLEKVGVLTDYGLSPYKCERARRDGMNDTPLAIFLV